MHGTVAKIWKGFLPSLLWTLLYDVIESNVRSLTSLDVTAESYGSLLSSWLMNKLPAELRVMASRKFGDTDSWESSALLKVIEEVQVRE